MFVVSTKTASSAFVKGLFALLVSLSSRSFNSFATSSIDTSFPFSFSSKYLLFVLSSLDAVLEAMSVFMKKKTVIMVSHRMTGAEKFNRVVRMD